MAIGCISPGDLLVVLYQLTKFEAPRYNKFRYTCILITVFMPTFAKGNSSKKSNQFFKTSPGNLLIILYHLTEFEAPIYNSFRDIISTNFQLPNLQRAIIRKNKFFPQKNNHQVIFSSFSISCQSLKPLTIIVLDYQFSMPSFALGK